MRCRWRWPAAHLTDGLVDPTVGATIAAFGYDRDFASLPADGPQVVKPVGNGATWRDVRLEPDQRMLTVPSGLELDLGATAKALAADRGASPMRGCAAAGCW